MAYSIIYICLILMRVHIYVCVPFCVTVHFYSTACVFCILTIMQNVGNPLILRVCS